MSRENVENVRRSFDLWKRGDLEGWLETIDPAIGGTSPPIRSRMFETGAAAVKRSPPRCSGPT
jgi:ketosteroid isomerase-like protein